MEILLPQIKTFCQDKFSWVRRSDITLIPNPGLIPEGVGFPHIGIKDGAVDMHFESLGNAREDDLVVEIYIYDRLGRSEKNILALHVKGKEVMDALSGHCFPGGVISAVPRTQIPVALLNTKKGLVIRKGLRFKYEREV